VRFRTREVTADPDSELLRRLGHMRIFLLRTTWGMFEDFW